MKRKPIYLVRMQGRGVIVSGTLTIAPSGYIPDAQRNQFVAAFLQTLRDAGLEVTPKPGRR